MSDTPRPAVALVTGGARGIGRDIAMGLIAAGVRVVVADPLTDDAGIGADPAAARARAAEIGALAFAESIASPGAATQAPAFALREAGGLDILVNTATIRRDAPIDKAEPGDWDAVLATNLSAAAWMIAACCRLWLRDGAHGRIVNVVAPVGGAGRVAGAAAAAGLIGLTRAAASDLERSDIKINAVLPRAAGSDRAKVVRAALLFCARAPIPPNGEIWRE